KIVNAIWIDARSQPKVCWISGTKRVQAYWMFAVATMQTTPTTSCSQRVASDTCCFSAGFAFSLIRTFLQVKILRPDTPPGSGFFGFAVRSVEGLVEFQRRVFER